MWWDDDESRVGAQIRELVGPWREGDMPSVTVLGSTWDETGERTLFLGIDPKFDLRPWIWAPGGGLLSRLTRRLIQRYGPLSYPEDVPSLDQPIGSDVIVEVRPRRTQAVLQLLTMRLGLRRHSFDFLKLPIWAADPDTRELMFRFGLPPQTLIGYMGPIRALSRKKGTALFRFPRGPQATVGCLVRAERGTFLTTAGHLGAEVRDTIYRQIGRKWLPYGSVVAVTSPDAPDPSSAVSGVDIAAVATNGGPPFDDWPEVSMGDPRLLRRKERIFWTGARTGRHDGWLDITARMAKALEDEGDAVYEHALMVIGNPPRLGGDEGDSGTAMYDSDGQLLGHLVGTDGSRQRGLATAVWFQMIDVAHPYLEEKCGSIQGYYGDRGL